MFDLKAKTGFSRFVLIPENLFLISTIQLINNHLMSG